MSISPDLIRLEEVVCSYKTRLGRQHILDKISLKINAGETCALVGASGSGKSTLLNMIGLLDRPTSGKVIIDGKNVSLASADFLAIMRNRLIGFVFQSYNLLPRLDVLDNVALPLLYGGVDRHQARVKARVQLELLGLVSKAHRRPADLSGGQRQRVAIARALVGSPSLILADEPTGNLDLNTARGVIDLLLTLNREKGTTLVIATHDLAIADQMGRLINISGGRLLELQ